MPPKLFLERLDYTLAINDGAFGVAQLFGYGSEVPQQSPEVVAGSTVVRMLPDELFRPTNRLEQDDPRLLMSTGPHEVDREAAFNARQLMGGPEVTRPARGQHELALPESLELQDQAVERHALLKAVLASCDKIHEVVDHVRRHPKTRFGSPPEHDHRDKADREREH